MLVSPGQKHLLEARLVGSSSLLRHEFTLKNGQRVLARLTESNGLISLTMAGDTETPVVSLRIATDKALEEQQYNVESGQDRRSRGKGQLEGAGKC